jgi:putative thioredoxin
MLDQILRQLPITGEADQVAQEIAPLITMGEDVIEQGDGARAVSIFEQLSEMAPEDPAVISGLARALLLDDQLAEAEALLDSVAPDKAKDPAIGRARAAVALAKEAKPVDDLTGLAAQVEADPDNHQLRYELAGGLMAAGERDAAADALLEIIRRDRAWNEGAARDRLLKLFEVVGIEDPWVSAQRRRLSAILFT